MPARKFRRQLTASYFAPFVAMAVLAVAVLWSIDYQISVTKRVEHSDQVLMRADDAESELRGMQAAVRGYLLSSDKRFSSEFRDGQRALEDDLDKLAVLVTDNPPQEERLLRVSDLKGHYIGALENLIAQKNDRQFSSETFAEAANQERAMFNALEAFITAEHQVRVLRSAHQESQNQLVFLLVPLLSALAALLLFYWGWRHIQLASLQFGEALTEAEKASRAKDSFLGTVSHELRNPLNSILLWTSTLLSDKDLNEKTRRGLTAIDRAGKAQTQLIEDLLDISRIESGRMRLDVQSVDLAEVVKAGVESMRAAAEAKSIVLREIIDSRVPPVAGDPHRLQQVLWNLVSNAVKYTPKGGKIEVRVERINSHVEISVADTGHGIEAAALPFVFDRFWQAERSGGSSLGVGLGLAIVKEIVGLHGGTVTAHSKGPSKGSTFRVRLPLPISTTASGELRRHPTVSPMASVAGAGRLDGASILIVDDDPEACHALENLLGALGASVTAATSAQAALELLQKAQPDAIVSDVEMPLRDGYFFAQELRRRELEASTGRHVPLVALTAYGRVEDKVQILASGFDAHVVKPADPAELAAILRSVMIARGA